MNKDNLTIYDNFIESARIICSSIPDINLRNRAVANVIAAKIASRYFDLEKYEVDVVSGLHNIPKILEDVDISDIYVNGSYIDVRVYFSEDELCVPKFHFDAQLTPVLYMFIKLSQDLTTGKVMGFIKPEFISKDYLYNDYYYLSENSLSSFYDIESLLIQTSDPYNVSNELLYKFLENSLVKNESIELIKKLTLSRSARTALNKQVKAQAVYNAISLPNSSIGQIDGITEDISQAQNFNESEFDRFFEPNEEKDIAGNTDNYEDTTVTEADDLYEALEYTTEVTPSNSELIGTAKEVNDSIEQTIDNEPSEESEPDEENEEQLEALFTGEQEGIPVKNKSSNIGILLILLVFALLISGALYWYSNFYNKGSMEELPDNITEVGSEEPLKIQTLKEEAMPNETVDSNQQNPAVKEEGNAVAIPAIEQHLDASVLVSNLKVDWEVPAGYASNNSAKRYLIKLGKIIQLNLKTELLLLSKPPISDKITVELRYNDSSNKFEVIGIKDSSGEKTVDDTILRTLKSALESTIGPSTESFGKLQGNPVLIIHL